MTREEAKEYVKVLQAYAEGKDIQVKLNNGTWCTMKQELLFNKSLYNYRIKPESKKIHLDESDITPTTKFKAKLDGSVYSIQWFDANNVKLFREKNQYTYNELMKIFEISTTPDRFEWRPAWKEVQE